MLVERELAIRAFDAEDRELALSEVARKTGLTRAAARRFLLTLVELGPGDVVGRDDYRIEAFAVEHCVSANGYALVEEPRPGRFDLEAAKGLGVPEGPLFGRLHHRFASHLLRLRKPDDAIYAHVEGATGVRGMAIVFFDDVAENVDAARRRGWHAYRIDPAPDDPLPQVRSRLRAHGVV